MALSPQLARQAGPVLAAINATPFATPKELAEALQRDASNLSKSLKTLHAAELISAPAANAHLTDAGLSALEAWRADDRPAEPKPANDAPAGFAEILHATIAADPLNPRKDFESEDAKAELAELAEQIAAQGLLQNLVVRPAAPLADHLIPMHRLVAGERRWRAIGLLIAEGRWPGDRAIPVQIREMDDGQHRAVALVENLQRRDLKPLEEADGLQALIEATGQSTEDVAKAIGKTQRFVQQRLQLLKLPPIKRAELAAGKITIEKARNYLANMPEPLDLPAADWLIALEVYDKLCRDPIEPGKSVGNSYARANKVPDDLAEQVERLGTYPLYLICVSEDRAADYVQNGLRKVSSGHYLDGKVRIRFGDQVDQADARREMLAELRREAFGPKATVPPSGIYSTPFLNGPFEVDAELLAEGDAERARRKADQEARAAYEVKAREHAAKAWAKTQQILAHQRVNLTTLTPAADATPLFAEAMAEVARRLPWRLDERANIVDADNRVVIESRYYTQGPGDADRARQGLIVAAVNAAGGVETPEDLTPPQNRSEFVHRVAEILADIEHDEDEDGPEILIGVVATNESRAEAGLSAYLTAQRIEYGDPEYDWEDEGARSLAYGIRDDRVGGETAAESADPDLSPAMLALATGKAAPIADAAELEAAQ